VSYLVGEVFELGVDCPCGWAGTIASYRGHLVRDHCNIAGCGGSADVLVSFGYRNPSFIKIGASLGVCSRHRGQLGRGRMHMIVEDLRRLSQGR
jgi:hypothetical protein